LGKAKYFSIPIANQYREGKVKSSPMRAVKKNLKPQAYKETESRSRDDVVLFVERTNESIFTVA
jgi:hypothetical protein